MHTLNAEVEDHSVVAVVAAVVILHQGPEADRSVARAAQPLLDQLLLHGRGTTPQAASAMLLHNGIPSVGRAWGLPATTQAVTVLHAHPLGRPFPERAALRTTP